MNLTALAAAVSAALAGVAGYALAWNIQAKILVDTKLEHANERIEQQRGARAAIERATTAVTAAQNAAATRNVSLAADRTRAADSGNGLRIASTTAVRASTADLDACAASLDAHSVVLGQCSERLVEVAGDADQWASHAVTFQNAWPTQ